jgi:hypothetical protein
MLSGFRPDKGVNSDTWAEQMRRSWVPRQQAMPISTWE